MEDKLAALSEEINGEVYSLQKTGLRSTLADLYQATGRYNDALKIYRHELSQAPRARRSWLTHGYVRALCALRQQGEAQKQAEAAVSITDTLSKYHQQRARLALGISLWPSEESVEPLLDTHRYFAGNNSLLATESAFHLAPLAFLDADDAMSVKATIDKTKTLLTLTGMRLLAGQAFADRQGTSEDIRSLRLFTLGKAELYLQGTPVTIRSRRLELLTLLTCFTARWI